MQGSGRLHKNRKPAPRDGYVEGDFEGQSYDGEGGQENNDTRVSTCMRGMSNCKVVMFEICLQVRWSNVVQANN